MTNENETVEQVHEDVKGRVAFARSLGRNSLTHSSAVADVLEYINEQYLSAHKREIEAKDAEIADLKDKNTEAFKAVLKRDNEIKRLNAYRDGECERIKLGAEPCKGCHVQVANDEIDSLRSLVKELADALDYARSCLAEYTYPSDESRKLVAKAREAVNG